MKGAMSQAGPCTLLGEFPAVTHDDWRQLVEKELKGAPFEKKMFTRTVEGITLAPIYCRADVADLPHVASLPGLPPFVRGTTAGGYVERPWQVSQALSDPNPTEFNHAARHSIDRGLNALNVVLDRATRNGIDPDWAPPGDVGFGGLSLATCDDLDRALDGICLDKISLFVRSGASALPFAALLLALARRRGIGPSELRGCIEMDPLGVLAHEGKLPQSTRGSYREMAVLTGWAATNAPQLRTICVHSRAWHEGGCHAVQELAYTLATGVEYLRELSHLGLDVNTVAPRMRFAVTVGTNFFLEIAKLRALRMLWSRAVAVAGGHAEAQKLSLHVRTSLWNKSTVDPYNNLLRSTVEAFAGVLGGCDSMEVGAFDEVVRRPGEFSLRIARNTQLVLQKECGLTHVIDPVGGSWFVEKLTSELATRAWTMFQEVEKSGGMEAAMRAGGPQRDVAATALAKVKAVTSRRESLVGVTRYADPKQSPLDVPEVDTRSFHKRRALAVAAHRTSLEEDQNIAVLGQLSKILSATGPALFDACVEAVGAGATLGEITRSLRGADLPADPLTPVCITRVAAPVEGLRAAMDRRAEGPASVFLCNMGPLKDHKARADFVREFFAVGGYEAISPEGFSTPEAAIEAFGASGSEVVVICSTDENYPSLVPRLVAGLRAGKPGSTILLAGYPVDQIEAHKKSGVDGFVHLRADVLDVLTSLPSKPEISR